MDKSCVPVANLAASEEKVLTLWQNTHCIWFCSDNFNYWVSPGKGLFHQFFKTIFVAWMKPLRIQYNRCLTCHKLTFCQHASKSMDARRKTLNCTKANWNAFYTCGSLAVSRSQSEFLIKLHSVQRSGAGRMCQRRKSIDFGNMWQLRIWYLDIDGLRAWRKILNCTKATRNAFYICGSLGVSRSQSDFLAKKTLRCEKVELGELSPCSKPSKQWEFLRLR